MKKTLIIIAIFTTIALGVTVKHNISINAFNAGELSPLINSRSDLAQYKTGAKTLENMLVRSQGPIQRRPGTQYIATAKYNTNVRLIPFEYSTSLSYVIETGHEYMRFYRTADSNSAQIVDDDSSATEIVTPYDGNDIFELQFAQDAQYMRIVHPDYQPYVLSRADHNDWTCSAIDFEGGPFLKENKDTSITITADALTGDVNLVATGDIFDANHVGALWQITHTLDSNSIRGYFWASGLTEWFYDYNDPAHVETPYTPTITIQKNRYYDVITQGDWYGTITIQRSYDSNNTWDNVYSYSSYASGNLQYTGVETEGAALYRLKFEIADAIAQHCQINLSTRIYKNHGIVLIDTYTDANNVSGTVETDYPIGSTDATYHWAEGAWSTYRGWPRTITHHEQRVVYGGSESYPETIWASVIMEDFNDYNDFDAGESENDKDAWIYTLPGYNPIQWMVSREYLMVGTTRGVGRLGQPDKPITPTYMPTYRMQAINGCEYIQAQPASDTILFVERGGKKVREVTYTYTSERYIAPDMTILAEHITGDGITSIAYQEKPDPILWCIRSDGALLSFTYNRHYGVQSWAEHTTSDDEFESAAVISGETEDELWLAVDRNIDSNDLIYVERLKEWDWGSDEADMWFVDCGGTDPNDLSQLEGETVCLLGDGVYIGDYVVSGGEAETDSYTDYVLGLPYTSKFETLPIVAYTDYGGSSSYYARIQNLVLDLYESYEFDIGTSTYKSTQNIDELYTGVRPTEFPRGQFREPTIYIDVNDPTPLTLRGITAQVSVDYVD